MTPEREAEIREWIAEEPHRVFYGSHWLRASDLLAEIDALRINCLLTHEIVLKKYSSLKAAAKHVTTVFHDERKGDLRLAIDSLSVALEEK